MSRRIGSGEQDNVISNQLELYRVIASLVHGGDTGGLPRSSGQERSRPKIKTMAVSLGACPRRQFALFENWHFVFEP